MELKEVDKIINIRDAVKTFYVATDKELESATNYYICLLIQDAIISFTNDFSLLKNNFSSDGRKIYKLNLFKNEVIIPFNILEYVEGITMKGIIYSNEKIEIVDTYNEIYYEKSDIDYKFNQCIEIPLVYNESDLTKKIRETNDVCRQYYKSDNVLRCMLGLCGLAYGMPIFSTDHCI
jgi:hypothetical protein